MKHTKHLLRSAAVMLSLVLILALLPGSACAAASGDFEYRLYSDGTAAITKYTGSAEHVTVPAVIDGHNVITIAADTFYGYGGSLDSILSITFSEGIERVAQGVIAYCDGVETVSFPSTLLTLSAPFEYSDNIRYILFPNGNPNLTVQDNVVYNKDMTSLLVYPAGKTDERFVAPGSLRSIAADAFHSQNYIREVILPDSLTTIGYWAFCAARNLQKVNIPAECTFIGQFAFDHTSIRWLHIPAKLETLMPNNCPDALERITLDPANPYFTLYDECLYYVNEKGEPANLSLYCNKSPRDTLVLPDSATYLISGCLDYAYNLRHLDLGSNMQQIDNDVLPTYLEELIIPDTVIRIASDNFGINSIGLHRIYYKGTEEQWNAINGIADADIWEPVHFNVTDPATHSTLHGGTDNTCTDDGELSWSCVCGYQWIERPYGLGHVFGDWVLTEMDPPDHWVYESKCIHCDETRTETTDEPKCLYYDVDSAGFYLDSVIWADAKGITTGTSPKIFSPTDPCLRAQVVTFLWRAAGCPEPAGTANPFVDVKETDFYYKAVLWALEKGITAGIDADHFGPFAYCNRAQVVTFLYRTMGSPDMTGASNPFTDVPDGIWYTAPVLWAVEQGITNGLSATSFGPDSVCNRAQIVTFLFRTFGW